MNHRNEIDINSCIECDDNIHVERRGVYMCCSLGVE